MTIPSGACKSSSATTTTRPSDGGTTLRIRTSPDSADSDNIWLSDRVENVAIARLKPAEINDLIYRPVAPDDPSIVELSKDIRAKGILEPLVITDDNVIVSGHRRWVAAQEAGLKKVPVRRLDMLSSDERFEDYLVACNKDQRVKTAAEQIREEVIATNPDEAHYKLLAHRGAESDKAHARVQGAGLRILKPGKARARSRITHVKRPMLDASIGIIQQYRDYWPLTLRQIHYRLLTRNVLRNSGKRATPYINDQKSYKDLSDLLTRARVFGLVPWESIHDPTRPRTNWIQWDSVNAYTREQLDNFLCGYKRNLLQTQPAYVELVVEKITAQEIAERAAGYYHVPVGVGRGYDSVTNLEDTAERFRASGKDRFILLIAGDFDPEGENIGQTWDACLRDEHGIKDLTTVKVAVDDTQAARYSLPPLRIKEESKSSRRPKFEALHGSNVYELEAFEPDVLQGIMREAIRSVLDLDLFAAEQRREKEDARVLMACRAKVVEMLKDCDLGTLSSGHEGEV
jgi:hypothetical protein